MNTKINKKYILLILSCQKFSLKRTLQKKSWLSKLDTNQITYFHVIGHKEKQYIDFSNNLIVVNSSDDYYSLPYKIVKAIKYVQDLFQYDYIFKTDDDQMLYIPDFFTRLCLDLEKNRFHYGGFLIDRKSDYHTNGNSHPEYNDQLGKKSGVFLLKKTKYCNGRFYLLSKKVIKKCILPNIDNAINNVVEDHFIGTCITEGFKKEGYYFDTGSYCKDLSANRPHPFDDLNRICVNLQGGLGNQLFQICSLINYSINNQVDFFINRFKNDEYRIINKIELKRPTYWDNIFSDLSGYLLNVSNKILHTYPFKIKESQTSFQPLPSFDKRQSIWVLDGFFQSELYFRKNKEIIFQKLHLTTQRENIASRYSHLFQRKTISVHFRYGDYKIIPLYSLLDVDYYVNSLLLLKKELEKRDENFKNYTILYFYDIQDKEIISGHINFLKDVFDIPFTDINNLNLTDWQQLLLMSNCTHHVIANSTFSWWGAYLNDNNSKIVTYPEVWLDNNSINKDLIPSQWNIINIKINVINIFYINLKHRLDRKTSIETQLKNLKSFVQSFLFSCTRIEAIYNNNGAIGCGQSHILALQKADLMKLPYILIMEDDLILKKESTLKFFNYFKQKKKFNWDVIILSGNNIGDYIKFDNVLSRCNNVQTTGCYLIKKEYYQVLIKNFHKAVKKMIKKESALKYAIDQYWKILQKKDNWFIVNENIGYQAAGYSDIEKIDVDYTSYLN